MRVCSKQINNWSEEEQLDEEATSDTAIHPSKSNTFTRVVPIFTQVAVSSSNNLWPIKWRGPAAAAANKYRRREIDVNWKSIQVATSRQITVCCLCPPPPVLYLDWERFWIQGMRYVDKDNEEEKKISRSTLFAGTKYQSRSPVVVWRISIEFTLWGNVD